LKLRTPQLDRNRSINPAFKVTASIPDAVLPIPFRSQHLMMRPDAKVEKVYLYPRPVDFRKSINGPAAPVSHQPSPAEVLVVNQAAQAVMMV